MPLSAAHRKIGNQLLAWERQREPGFVSNLVRQLGYAAESSLTATLRVMERNGLVTIKGGGAKGRTRMVTLTSMGKLALGAGGLPLLGSIPAGPLAEAIAEADEVLDPGELFPYRDGDFLLRVRGDSMIGDGILNGDKVLLRPEVAAHSGEIAAVLVGDDYESTLKRIYFQPDKAEVILRASNPKYPDLVTSAEAVKIAGVFRGLIRNELRHP